MNWRAEVRKYKPVLADAVVHFTTSAKKTQVVEVYNRALRQLQHGHLDMAAITLNQLANQYPNFVQAVQLNACCQMLWSNTQLAIRPLYELLKGGLMTKRDRARTQLYIDEILQVAKSLSEKKLSDIQNLPKFRGKVPDSLFQREQNVFPIELATKEEVAQVVKGEVRSTTSMKSDVRKTVYGSTFRVSTSNDSDRLIQARQAEEARMQQQQAARTQRLKELAEAKRKAEEAKREAEEAAKRQAAKRKAEDQAKAKAKAREEARQKLMAKRRKELAEQAKAAAIQKQEQRQAQIRQARKATQEDEGKAPEQVTANRSGVRPVQLPTAVSGG